MKLNRRRLNEEKTPFENRETWKASEVVRQLIFELGQSKKQNFSSFKFVKVLKTVTQLNTWN